MQNKGQGDTIDALFSRKQYKIPIYQRRYVWNEEYWDTLWKDIKKKFSLRLDGKPSSHFTGVIITRVYKDKGIGIPKIDILDGQQRLTTFQIILCAIRDICREIKYNDITEKVSKLLVNQGDDAKYKLCPKKGLDEDVFCALIDSKCRQTHIIDDAYTHFEKEIKELVIGDREKIESLYKTIIHDFRMISIDVNEWGDPEQLFAIIQVPGKILDEFDWLRNYLFLRAGEDREKWYDSYWSHFDTEDYWKETEKQEAFFQTFLMAKLGPDVLKKEAKLFELYRDNLISGRCLEEEFKDIKNYAKTYEELDMDSEFKIRMKFYKDLSTYREEGSDNSYFMSQYKDNIMVIRSFIMHLQHELKKPLNRNEILRVFEILESYVMRRLLEDSFKGTSAYQAIKHFFRGLFNPENKGEFSVVNMVDFLVRRKKGRWISNPAVKSWFENNGYHKHRGSSAQVEFIERYILYRIENWERMKDKKELLSFEKEKQEFPPSRMRVQKYDKLKDEDAWNSLGNLTFCWGHDDSPRDADFDMVKKFLQDHNNNTMILNRNICGEDNWGTSEIGRREDKLLETFHDIWKSEHSFLNNTIYWQGLEKDYKVGRSYWGKVRNVSGLGVTVQLKEGVEGVIRPQEITWTRRRNIDPSEYVNEDDVIEVKILEISEEKQTLSLSKKQTQPDPWAEVPEKYKVGDIVRGKIYNIVSWGAFAELQEGITGLIHISEMADRRVDRPEEIVSIREELDLKVIDINIEERKIALSLKAVMHDPWAKVSEKYKVGDIVQGKIVSLTDLGAFAELDRGIRGLIHNSKLADKQFDRPEEIVSIGEELDLKVIRVRPDKREIELSLKAVMHDPWTKASEKYKVGTVVRRKIDRLTDFGAFVELEEGIDGLIYNSELSDRWFDNPEEIVSVGDVLDLKVISLNAEEMEIGLSLIAASWEKFARNNKVGSIVPGKIVKLTSFGAFAELEAGLEGLIHISDLANRHIERPEEIVKVGDKLDMRVIRVDREKKQIGLSLTVSVEKSKRKPSPQNRRGKKKNTTLMGIRFEEAKRTENTNKSGN